MPGTMVVKVFLSARPGLNAPMQDFWLHVQKPVLQIIDDKTVRFVKST